MSTNFSINNPKVSVIIPVYNEESTVALAVESVALQKTEFNVEIIVVDDCSTDDTPVTLDRLTAKFSNLKVLRNERNSGKGFSFKRAYDISQGEYFHVLDGDDCFVFYDKLQRQVGILDLHREYFAVGHNTLVSTPDGAGVMHSSFSARDWENVDCLSGRVYCHTSSILYRKLVDKLPDFFYDEEFRGDTGIFFYSAFISKLKFRYVPNVWSIYDFHGFGLWSSLKHEQQQDFNRRIIEALNEKIVKDPDSEVARLLDERLERSLSAKSTGGRYSETSLEDILTFAERASSKVFHYRDEAFKGMHAFRLVDELCEAAGRAICMKMGLVAADREIDDRLAVILVSGLVPGGGGVFREIQELTEILLNAGYQVKLISTSKIPTDLAIFEEHFGTKGIRSWQADAESSRAERLTGVLAQLAEARPGLLFPFITHNDPVGVAAIQRPLGARVIFDFVYDHGLSLAVLNSSIDQIIVKTVSQARALSPMIPHGNFSLVPPFFSDRFGRRDYLPKVAGTLTTASAAARAYKVEGEYKYSYLEIVPKLLKISGGRHIHLGPLSDETLATIRAKLTALGVAEERFHHIPWSDDFGGTLISENVDLFIAPFPICSARIAIEVMACGIPIVSHLVESPGIAQGADFVDPQQFVWKKPQDIYDLVERLDETTLRRLSESARAYFETNNLSETAAKKLKDLQPLILPKLDNPEFVMSEFSEIFELKLDTAIFGGLTVSLPRITQRNRNDVLHPEEVSLFPDKYWHRTAFRQSLRKAFHKTKRGMVSVLAPRRHH